MLLFTLFVVNQVAQLVALAERISPVIGTVTLWTLVTLCLLCLLVPVYLILRLPRALVPPATESDPRFPRYLEQLKARLKRNPRLSGATIETREDVEAALEQLGVQADQVTRQTALRVLVSTAVLQNGSLDAISVLVAQSRMVYEIATIYTQRPSLMHLARLYSNVAVSTFLARQLDDIDLAELVQPFISVGLTSAVGTAVPGATKVMSLVTDSLLQGSANAFLTLRVGVIAKRYCGSVVSPSRRSVGRAAVLEATKMIPSVVKEASLQVGGALGRALGGRVKEGTGAVVKGFTDKVKSASSEVTKGVTQVAASVLEKLKRQEKQDAAESE